MRPPRFDGWPSAVRGEPPTLVRVGVVRGVRGFAAPQRGLAADGIRRGGGVDGRGREVGCRRSALDRPPGFSARRGLAGRGVRRASCVAVGAPTRARSLGGVVALGSALGFAQPRRQLSSGGMRRYLPGSVPGTMR